MNKYLIAPIVLNLFDATVNTTTTLSDDVKTYYADYLIDLVEPELVHDQFAMKHPIPKNGGKTIEFRGFSALPAVPSERELTEGVTPAAQTMEMFTIPATVYQYGGYVILSDMLLMTAIDNNVIQATNLIASQAGRTLDAVTRDTLVSEALIINDGAPEAKLTVDLVRRAANALKRADAPKINGYYVAIVHPDVAYDLVTDPEWIAVKNYDSEDWYNGEIGRIAGVRFVESTRAYFEDTGSDTTYTTLFLGANAYAVTEITGGGLEHIVKQLGYGDDPLNQRASVGWKASRAVEVLVKEYTYGIETKSNINT